MTTTEQDGLLAVKRGRKRSWVGVEEEKPHAYLREAMVSGLMDGICNPEDVGETLEPRRIVLDPDRLEAIVRAIPTWNFSAHDFSDDELLHAASLMLQHALSMQELEQWRIPADNLHGFLLATRMAYNDFVPYHNFRHVVDVLQAVFYFLLQLGALPSYPPDSAHPPRPPTPIASLVRPFDALTLLITAVGHDVGHPGVNNAFLVNLKAPLAQLYNDRSVLESFHCAAFSQILRRYWPSSFHSADMRRLLINSILATDMGLHFDYMKRLGRLQQELRDAGGIDHWDGRYLEEQRTLTCSLLIKCADISNVARKYDVAAQWAIILTDEFARQASMETDLGIPSALFAPPMRDSVVELGKSQIGFMNLFALPLFEGVSDILPAMQFSVDEILANKRIWEGRIADGVEKERSRDNTLKAPVDHSLSPRSRSVSTLSQPPEQHPPAIVATAHGCPFASPRVSLAEPVEISPRSSLSKSGYIAGSLPDPSRRSSLGSPLSLDEKHDITPKRSSGGFPGGIPQSGRSSNTTPTQLQLGMNSSENRRSSADHSLVAVLVTSSGKPPRPAEPQQRQSQRKSSEKSSLPSSNEWQSQVTSPTTVACSPTTEATSFVSEASSEKGVMLGRPSHLKPMRSADSAEQHQLWYNGSSDTKVLRQRPSRWKLSYWRNRRKAQSASASP